MAYRRLIEGAAIACVFCGVSVLAQSGGTGPAEVADIASGWAALSARDFAKASVIANTALSHDPRNLAAATVLVESETLRAGAVAGLSSYEQWLANRSAEDPYLLRVVAIGFLREAIRDPGQGLPKKEAYAALAAEGDEATLAELGRAASNGSPIEMQVLGALGSEPMVRSLIAMVRSTQGDRSRAIAALVDTHSPLAVAPLVEVLSDRNPVNRAAAADGLGKLGDPQTADALRPLLTDANFTVQFTAARSLYLHFHDASGLSLLTTLEGSEFPSMRALALEATAVDVDQRWLGEVRDLLADNDPQVRMAAAKLIAPYDPAAANAAFQGLLSDGNVAIREATAETYADTASDLPSLRRFLRSADALARVRAAKRTLELCR